LIENLLNIIQASRGWNIALVALFSIAVSVAASNFGSSLAQSKNSPLADQLRQLGTQSAVRVFFEIMRLIYYIGIPFAALYVGWIDLRSMGLGVLDWADGVRWAIVILLASWLLLMAIWLPYLRATGDVYATPETQASFPRRLVELVYMQAHWAFYRAAAIIFLQTSISDPLYWGTVVGLGLTSLEAIAAPQVRNRLTRIGAADGIVWNFGQAIINSLGFVVTRNVLLLVVIHFLLDLTVPHLRAHFVPRATLSAQYARAQTIREQKHDSSQI
jgi:hypothetical protein